MKRVVSLSKHKCKSIANIIVHIGHDEINLCTQNDEIHGVYLPCTSLYMGVYNPASCLIFLTSVILHVTLDF